MISSTGGASQFQGDVLGHFKYLEDQKYYVQSSTDQSDEMFEAVYLYPDEEDNWWVNDTPGKKEGWLQNPNPSTTPPRDGWKYYDGTSWTSDVTLTVTPGKGKLYDENIAQGNLLKERESLKSKLDNEIVVPELILKEKRDLEDSSTKERDSLKRELDDEIKARENILIEKKDLAPRSWLSLSIILTLMIVFLAVDRYNLNCEVENLKSRVENLLKKKRDLEYSIANERDNLKRKLDVQIPSMIYGAPVFVSSR